MNSRGWRSRPVLFVAAVALVALAVAAGLHLVARPQASSPGSPAEDLRTVLEVVGVIRTYYLEPVGTVELLAAYARTGTVNGMLREALGDPYTRYMNPRAYQQMQIETAGHYAGIGIYLGIKDERLTVISPIPGTPAARAGLRAGDRIVAVDGRPTADMSQDEATGLIRGPKGTPVRLTIERDGQQLEVEIVRDEIDVPAVAGVQMLDGQIGYVRLLQFSEKAGPELDAALSRLEQEGYRALVLDLRNNPGGLLSAAVEVADLFLARGPIVHILGRGGERQTISASPFRTHPTVPMAVLVNGGTASASEIVAGALRDHGLAVVVGTHTFGKGLVQTVVPLRRGDAVSVTTQKYQTAGGHFIDEGGIQPDMVVEPPEELADSFPALDGELDPRDVQLQRAVELLRRQLEERSRAAQAGGGPAPARAARAAA